MNQRAAPRSTIRTGVAGWAYPDWDGIFYPERRPRGFHELSYLAEIFSTVEIDSSFYRPPQAEWARRWVSQVEARPDFLFTAKLWRGFTHERNATPDDARAFVDGVAPLARSQRLGALLLQFPWSFKNTTANRDYVSRLLERFGEYPRVVEVRHGSWNDPDFLAWLRERGAGICNIDQPLIGSSLAPSSHVAGTVGYVRLHGRNAAQWFTKNQQAGERYDYLYSTQELEPWAKRVQCIAENAGTVFVIANNHPNAQAAVNALELAHMLTGEAVNAPEALVRRYPRLQSIAAPLEVSHPQQGGFEFPQAAGGSPE